MISSFLKLYTSNRKPDINNRHVIENGPLSYTIVIIGNIKANPNIGLRPGALKSKTNT